MLSPEMSRAPEVFKSKPHQERPHRQKTLPTRSKRSYPSMWWKRRQPHPNQSI
jgi:hypothetical protein